MAFDVRSVVLVRSLALVLQLSVPAACLYSSCSCKYYLSEMMQHLTLTTNIAYTHIIFI
jgi:hypothetical protein